MMEEGGKDESKREKEGKRTGRSEMGRKDEARCVQREQVMESSQSMVWCFINPYILKKKLFSF